MFRNQHSLSLPSVKQGESCSNSCSVTNFQFQSYKISKWQSFQLQNSQVKKFLSYKVPNYKFPKFPNFQWLQNSQRLQNYQVTNSQLVSKGKQIPRLIFQFLILSWMS